MDETQAGRLLTLAYFLKKGMPDEYFDMGSYARTAGNALPNLTQPECGTTACALGWCSVVFPDNFRLRAFFVNCQVFGLAFRAHPDDSFVAAGFSDDRICEFFGITTNESEHLFKGEPRTPKQEACVIEQLVDKYGYTYAK